MDKETFHRTWKRNLRRIAKDLGLAAGTFDVRSNKGGDGILGEAILHSDTLYLHVGGSCCEADRPDVYFRSCAGRKDYTGGRNQWTDAETLLTPRGIDLLRAAMTGGQPPRFGPV